MRDLVLGYREDELKGMIIELLDGVVKITASTEVEREFLQNSIRFLDQFGKVGLAPELMEKADDYIVMQHIPDEEITDEVLWRRNCAKAYAALQKFDIRHGDLTRPNIRCKSNAPVILDWHQAFTKEDDWPFEKRPEGDGYWFWKTVAEMSPDTSRHLRRWNAIRDDLQGEKVYDYGCDEADFGLFCRSEGIEYHGFDINEDAINRALAPASVADITEMGAPEEDCVILLMSVWAHLGIEDGTDLLERITKGKAGIIFETQLEGDGPGIHRTDYDVYQYLSQFGYVDWLAQIPVHERNTARSVWFVS